MSVYVDNEVPYFDQLFLDYVKKGGSLKVLQSFFQDDNSNSVDSLGKTLLHHAAESDNVSMTQYCIDQKYNIDMLDFRGNSPVMLAVQNFCVDTTKMLIEAGACIYFRTDRGKSILPDRSDCKYGIGIYRDLDECELLSKYQVIIKMILGKVRKDCWHDEHLLVARLRYIDCSLAKAICLEDSNVTRLMLEDGYHSVDEVEPDTGETALHLAVMLGDCENVKVLLEFGANVHALDSDLQLSPIYFYDKSSKDTDEKEKILKLLIKHDALSTHSESRKNPSAFILSRGKLWAVNALMESGHFEWNPKDSLYYIIKNRNPGVLKVVRDKIFDVNSTDNPSKLPLLLEAVLFAQFEKIEFLIQNGANLNCLDQVGWTPLMRLFRFDMQKEYSSIVRLMLQNGADAQFSNQHEQSIFDLAFENVNSGCNVILESVTAHLALIESLGETITDFTHSKINFLDKLKSRYKKCKEQLKKMKNVMVYESISLYTLLTESQSKITGYARNEELVQTFNDCLKINLPLDPYYSISLRKRFGKAIHLTKLKKETVIVLSKIVGSRIRNYHELLDKIVEYLPSEDLKNTCRVSQLQESDSCNTDILFT